MNDANAIIARFEKGPQWLDKDEIAVLRALSARVAELTEEVKELDSFSDEESRRATAFAWECSRLRAQLAEAARQEKIHEWLSDRGWRVCTEKEARHYDSIGRQVRVRFAAPVPAQPSAFTPEECATIRAYVGTNLQNIGGPDGSILDRFAATALSLLEMPK